MKRNFQITASNEISFGKGKFDLHNDFDFVRLEWDVRNKNLSLRWKPRTEVAHQLSEFAIVNFDHVMAMSVKGVDPEMPRIEDARLSFMGYLHPEDLEVMDGFLLEESSSPSHHMIFAFEGGLVLKVFAEAANFELTSAES